MMNLMKTIAAAAIISSVILGGSATVRAKTNSNETAEQQAYQISRLKSKASGAAGTAAGVGCAAATVWFAPVTFGIAPILAGITCSLIASSATETIMRCTTPEAVRQRMGMKDCFTLSAGFGVDF